MPFSTLPPEFGRALVTTVHQGDCLVSANPDVTFSTVLGSCVSACIWDVAAGVGGMNHFLLAAPSGSSRDSAGASARYGAFAMEQLINKVVGCGSGKKANLEIKVFGGGRINEALNDIGANNIGFVRRFLADEGYTNVREDLGGTFARRVLFKPSSGRAFVKHLDSVAQASLVSEEMAAARRPSPRAPAVDIELF